jgi:hypothetical protein
MRRVVFLAVVALACPAWTGAQSAADPIDVTVERVSATLNAGDRAGFTALFGPSVPPPTVGRYADDLIRPGAIRTVVRERDRGPLEAVPPGDGFRMVVEIFVESAGRGRILTAEFSIRRRRHRHLAHRCRRRSFFSRRPLPPATEHGSGVQRAQS